MTPGSLRSFFYEKGERHLGGPHSRAMTLGFTQHRYLRIGKGEQFAGPPAEGLEPCEEGTATGVEAAMLVGVAVALRRAGIGTAGQKAATGVHLGLGGIH